jgi:hypothetical protein
MRKSELLLFLPRVPHPGRCSRLPHPPMSSIRCTATAPVRGHVWTTGQTRRPQGLREIRDRGSRSELIYDSAPSACGQPPRAFPKGDWRAIISEADAALLREIVRMSSVNRIYEQIYNCLPGLEHEHS